MFEFISLVQVNIPSFCTKTIHRFTISQFDYIPYVEPLRKAVDAPDGDTHFRENFTVTELETNNFIFNMKEVVFVVFLMICFFAIVALLFMACLKWKGFCKKLLKQLTYNAWLRLST